MSILQEIEDDKKKLAELEGEDHAEENEGTAQPEDGSESEGPEDEGSEDGEPDSGEEDNQKSSEETDEEEVKLDDAGYARLRRENAALKRRLAEQPVAQASPQPAQTEPATSEEPDIKTDPAGWLLWNKEQQDKELKELRDWKESLTQEQEHGEIVSAAEKSLQAYEADFRLKAKDYDDVASFMVNKMAEGIRVLHPYYTPEQMAEELKTSVLVLAGNFEAQGLDPAEEMYLMAKEQYGYAPKEEPKKEAKEEEKPKPDPKKLANNRSRNAGTAAAPGSGGSPDVTLQTAADMPIHEFAKLSKEEKQKLLSS